MDVKCTVFLVFLLLGTCLHFSWARLTKADTDVIRVPNDFPTIQEAINTAENGSTILVNKGIYCEHVSVNKTLMLLGASKEDTIIDASPRSGATPAITVASDNVLINGFTVRGGPLGFYMSHSNNCIVSGNVVTLSGSAGIGLDHSYYNTILNNIVSSTIGSPIGVVIPGHGIKLISSANNTISNNIVVGSSGAAFFMENSDNNSVLRNVIENNGEIIEANASDDNLFSLNNIVHYNALIVQESSSNSWSKDGEGNYWDDYVGLDDGSDGRTAGDGVGDTDLPWRGVDNYPLVNPVNPLLIFWDNMLFPVSIVSNSTVSALTFSPIFKEIVFSMIGPPNTRGYFNVSIPKKLLSGPWRILLGDANVIFRAKVTENQTYTTIYVNDSRSTHNVEIIGTNVIPEYPNSSTVLLVTLLTLTPTMLIAKKKRNKPSITKPELSRTDA